MWGNTISTQYEPSTRRAREDQKMFRLITRDYGGVGISTSHSNEYETSTREYEEVERRICFHPQTNANAEPRKPTCIESSDGKMFWRSCGLSFGTKLSTQGRVNCRSERVRGEDLTDLRAKRAPVSKAQLQARVRTIMRTEKAKVVASNCARGLKRVCQKIVENGGTATRG